MPDPEGSFFDTLLDHWNRFGTPASEILQTFLDSSFSVKVALSTLLALVFAGWAVYLWKIVSRIRRAFRKPKPNSKPGPGRVWPKRAAIVAAVLLPGGLLGTAAVALVMGKENWRRDALWIVGASMIPGLLLAWISSSEFPFPWLGENAVLRTTLTVTFGVLHLWATIKILRETLGEPPKNVAWWPPLALWLQSFILFTGIVLLS